MTGFRAGQRIDDLCRACKAVRDHTVMATDAGGAVVRVMCDFCRSEHNYRGGGPDAPPEQSTPIPQLSDRERTQRPMAIHDEGDLERLLRRIIREETGLTPVAIATRFKGGQLVFRPADPSLQEKVIPIETFFHKVVMVRNRLRTLEQQVNAAALPDDVKVKLQGYISGCYGSLTSFNVLFADEDDQFKGGAGD